MSGKQKAAFTLAEIMISIGIIGILAILMLSTTQFSNKDEKIIIGKKQQAESLVVSVSKALASGDTTGLALTALTQSDESLRDGFAPKLNTKNAQAVVNDFSGYDIPKNFETPPSLPGVELANGTTIAFQKLNTNCATVSDGGAPCALAYVDVNEKAAGDETPQFLMAIYRDRAVSEYELCEGYEGGKTTDVECPANLPNGNKKKVETCNLGVITATYSGVCCPTDQAPEGETCVCKNPDMVLAGGTCVCKDNKVNINGACVCEGKTEDCKGNMVGTISYDGVCIAGAEKTYTFKESTCKCPSDLPNLKSDGETCVAACSGGQVFSNDACKCPSNIPELVNGICTCPNTVKSCTAPKVGNIIYATMCSASGKVEGEKLTDTCTCPSKDKLSLGDKEIYSPSSESCKSQCPDSKVANSAHTACACPTPLVEKDGTCGCPQTPPSGYLAYNEAWDPSNAKTCKRLQKVFIIASYPTAVAGWWNQYSELTVEDMIKDFAIPTPTNDYTSQYLGNGDRTFNCGQDYDPNRDYKGCSGFSGSWYHNRDHSNDDAWMNLLGKMSDTDKKRLFYGGKAYVFLEDGKLLATVNSLQIAYYASNYLASTNAAYDLNFERLSDLGIQTKTADYVGEEGKGGQIKYNGIVYDVVYTIYRKQTPLVLDLKGDGLKFTNVANGVIFDLNADGQPEKTAWTDVQSEFDDSFLAYDKNNNGEIDNGAELFGAQNGAENGFYELMRYDDNEDNVINKKDAIFKELKLWCDMNKNGKVDDGELKTLDEAKVTEISLSFENQYDENGNLIEDEHGNTTGLVGSFKIMIEQVVDGVTKMLEVVRKMIDVLFNTIQGFFS